MSGGSGVQGEGGGRERESKPRERRSTAGRLAEFAEVLSESMVIEDLLPLYFTLCTDEQDSVRARSIRPKRPTTPGPTEATPQT